MLLGERATHERRRLVVLEVFHLRRAGTRCVLGKTRHQACTLGGRGSARQRPAHTLAELTTDGEPEPDTARRTIRGCAPLLEREK
jgi:hypothetical protein